MIGAAYEKRAEVRLIGFQFSFLPMFPLQETLVLAEAVRFERVNIDACLLAIVFLLCACLCA